MSSTISTLFRPKRTTFSSMVWRSPGLYSTATTWPRRTAMAASTAMLSPETQQMVSFSSRQSFFRMTARISGATYRMVPGEKLSLSRPIR